jgi:hypothetical protein
MLIEITAVTRGTTENLRREYNLRHEYIVEGTVGLRIRYARVTDDELAEAIGNDPANYSLGDLTPAIVQLAIPRLGEAFKS